MKFQLKTALFALVLCFGIAPALAQERAAPVNSAFRSTNYPLPRFVSIGSNEVYVRAGPGQRYPVEWVYTRKGVPVEIVLEYDVWRKIRDRDGETGWVHNTLLSGRRMGFVKGEEEVPVFKKPLVDAPVIALFEPELLVQVEECAQGWCLAKAGGYKGWVSQKNLWGVYEEEEFD